MKKSRRKNNDLLHLLSLAVSLFFFSFLAVSSLWEAKQPKERNEMKWVASLAKQRKCKEHKKPVFLGFHSH